jgi:UDP-2-acetamido-3-amino-2,3-dideoxy-glucuronate N-acetyltransferase
VVTKDVPAYALIYGVPTRQMGWVCQCGTTLPGVEVGGAVGCLECDSRYRLDEHGVLAPVAA